MIPLRVSLGDWSPVIRRIDDQLAPGESALALTFDDGPDPDGTPHLIAALSASDAHATFFLCGVRVERHPELVQALVDAGHDVYAHGWDHQNFTHADGAAAAEASARTEALLARYRPTPSTYLVRLPYNAGFTSAAIHRAMRHFHRDIQFAWWSHELADYSIADGTRPEADIRRACVTATARLERCNDLSGGILLLHDTAITQPHEAAAFTTRILLPGILDLLARRGIKGVSLKPRRQVSQLDRFAFRTIAPLIIAPDRAA
jgi:peptidoglycan/xylan/chitin deacetylase (PgdA/CDA1 family)